MGDISSGWLSRMMRGSHPAVWVPTLLLASVMLVVLATWTASNVEGHPIADAAAPGDGAHDRHDPAMPEGHEGTEGLALVPTSRESVVPGPACPSEAPLRTYQIVALAVEITYDRYLDHDPDGRMFALSSEVERVREEERRNAAARDDPSAEPAVSLGLQGDAIQPLTLRARPGECLRIELRNELPDDEAVSLHLHRSSLRVASTGKPAIATEPSAHALTDETVVYEWAIPPAAPQGTHYFHSEASARAQTSHGLFGALIVEPPGSEWLDPLDGTPLESGWQAMVVDPDGPDFRELVIYYHEVGDEDTKIVARDGAFVPVVDPITKAYRPASRALNYRSEPFMNRLALQASRSALPDESLAYSSYAFGDPATPIARTYLGDPTKERVVHAGSEVSHVHHVHGGSIRWKRDGGVEPDGFAGGLQKHPPLIPDRSERTDSQSLGPSESFDIAHECGAGGCQASAGDHLFHCHVAQHYFAGMWGIWRVYSTLQTKDAATDSLPPLHELPDRRGAVAAAVPSESLIGLRIDPGTGHRIVDESELERIVESQLPPAGVAADDDASVFDWSRSGNHYLGEPETSERWPGYRSPEPGARPALLFDPRTGRLAFPFLKPHLGKRPPFAPGHGPAPFLDPMVRGHDPPAPGVSGPASLCPDGTRRRDLHIEATSVPVPLDPARGIIDPHGQLFVLRDRLDALRAEPLERVPLVIRANAGEECLDVLLTNSITDPSGANLRSKVGLHIHFVQFDTLASDGLDTGFNYEQTIQPYGVVGRALAAPATAGETTLRLEPAGDPSGPLQPGALVAVGIDELDPEIRRIVSVTAERIVLDEALTRHVPAGSIVSTEFVRYRWYPDVQAGTTYFHDHVNALSSWRHGLFGALIIEPPGSTYHDPYDGRELGSGLVADIHTQAPVGLDVEGHFREFVLFFSDGTEINREGRSTGSSIDLRAESLDRRGGAPEHLLDSTVHGDPATPLLEAYAGDPLVLRTLVPATNDVHTVHIDGHPFRLEPWETLAAWVSTAHIGISERFDLVIPEAGGPTRRAGDYLYRNGRPFKFREGSWGILRVLDPAEDGRRLRPLPDRPRGRAGIGDVCPQGAPVRRFDVHAVEVRVPMLHPRRGAIYVLAADRDALLAGDRDATPLVLRARVGDCLKVHLTNETAAHVSFHADQLVWDPTSDAGLNVGRNPLQTTPPGRSRFYRLYAHPRIGETVALVSDGGDVVAGPQRGLYGAIVVADAEASFVNPKTGEDARAASDASLREVIVRTGSGAYRDVVLFLHDIDEAIGTHRMPYSTSVRGAIGLDYAAADADPLPGHADPSTPLIEAHAGDALRIHVVAPVSEQAQVFSIEGHAWPVTPGLAGSRHVDSVLIGGLGVHSLFIERAGGPHALPGDYVYGDHRLPYREAGLWGILRVHPIDAAEEVAPAVAHQPDG